MQNIKNNIISFFDNIRFEEEGHRYLINDNIQLDKSVSFFLKHFSNTFDSYNVSKVIANKTNSTQKDVLDTWKSIADNACKIGTDTHLFGEKYMFDRSLLPETELQKAIVKFWNNVPDHIEPLMSEVVMYHKEYLFGGTADILCYNKKEDNIVLLDYKTNRDLFKNYKNQKLKYPFNNILDNPFNKYQLQLSLYQILLEQVPDIPKVARRIIIWLKPDGSFHMYNANDYTEILKMYLKTYYEK